MGGVRTAVGAGEHGHGVVGGIDRVNHHVFGVDLDDVTGLEDGRIGDGQGRGVGGDGRTLIGGGAGGGVFVLQPFDLVPVTANLEFGTCRIKSQETQKRSIYGVDETDNVVDDTNMGGRIGIGCYLLVINCHVSLPVAMLGLPDFQSLLSELCL